jgi:antitoxin CcdA
MMQVIYETQAPKRAANLSINSDLLNKARALNINLSATLEESLIATIKAKQQEAWLAQNKQAIEAYNQQVEDQGVFADSLRAF